jgi:hypothetical protein
MLTQMAIIAVAQANTDEFDATGAALVNQTTGRTLALRARIAHSLWAQLVGLSGRATLTTRRGAWPAEMRGRAYGRRARPARRGVL